jgi:uncharacterized protein (DUF849 family)
MAIVDIGTTAARWVITSPKFRALVAARAVICTEPTRSMNMNTLPLLLEVALNGSRAHPYAPRTPDQLAGDARAAVDAGARVIHMHPFDDDGRETLTAAPAAAAVKAVRRACPGVPISLTTSAAIEPDPERRLAMVSSWTLLPELVTANQGETGIIELCSVLIQRGVGIEAGLLSISDARAFLNAGLAHRCRRVLVEPLDADPNDAVTHAAAIEDLLAHAGVAIEQVHHGDGMGSWAVNRRAIARGHGIRTGLEDTPFLPDGELAQDNAALVRAAAAMIRAVPVIFQRRNDFR